MFNLNPKMSASVFLVNVASEHKKDQNESGFSTKDWIHLVSVCTVQLLVRLTIKSYFPDVELSMLITCNEPESGLDKGKAGVAADGGRVE